MSCDSVSMESWEKRQYLGIPKTLLSYLILLPAYGAMYFTTDSRALCYSLTPFSPLPANPVKLYTHTLRL